MRQNRSFYYFLPRRSLLAVAALILFAFANFTSQAKAGHGDSVVLVGGDGEYYIAGLPSGWQVKPQDGEALESYGEWIPVDQTPQGWRDLITVQLFPQLANFPPEKFLERVVSHYAKFCDDVFVTDIDAGKVNEYATAFRVFACTRDQRSDKGNVAMIRAVMGEKAFYVVQRVYRVPAFTKATFPIPGDKLVAGQKAIAFGLACNRKDGKHPCPAEWTATLNAVSDSQPLLIYPAQH